MSLTKMTRLPLARLLSSIHLQQQQLLPLLHPSISPITSIPRRCALHSEYRRPGKPREYKRPWDLRNFDFKKAVAVLKEHFTLLQSEVHDRIVVGPEGRPLIEHMLEQNRVVWEFRGPESLKEWTVSSDREIGGQSEISLTLGKHNTCFLHGTLNTTPPRDGETRYSGYCTVRSKQPKYSFDRKKHHDWTSFNSLHLRVRGDGRPWMINIATENYYTHKKDDLYHYFMFTRGGPYWQDVKIPFSKFFLAQRGRVQDDQHPLWLDKINTIGFTLGDNADGPFQLEIDFIGVTNDYAHTEEFAYEHYKKNPEVKSKLS